MNLSFGKSGGGDYPHAGSNPGVKFEAFQSKTWDDGTTSYSLFFSKQIGDTQKKWYVKIPRVFTRKKSGELHSIGMVRSSLEDLSYFITNLVGQFCGLKETENVIEEAWKEVYPTWESCISGVTVGSVITDEQVWEQSIQSLYENLIFIMKACLESREGAEGSLLLTYGRQYLEVPVYCRDTCTRQKQSKSGKFYPDYNSSQSIFLLNGEHTLEGTSLLLSRPEQIGFESSQEVAAPAEPDAW